MANELDLNQDAVKCAYPPCKSARVNVDDDAVPPFCQVHLGQLEFLLFSVWVTPRIQVKQVEAPSKLLVPQVVAKRVADPPNLGRR